MAIHPRTNNARLTDENKVASNGTLHGAKPTNARSVLSRTIKSPRNTMKPSSNAHTGLKVTAGNKASAATKCTTAHIIAALAARKTRVPLSAANTNKAQLFLDPAPHVARARHTQPAPATVVVAPATKKAAQAVVARVVATAEITKAAPPAGQKRRTNVIEPERAVQAKVSKYSTAPTARKADASAEPSVPDYDSDSADSQATVVKYELPADAKLRKIAKPSRAFSSLRTLAGQTAEVDASSKPSAYVPDSDTDSADSQATVVEHELPADTKQRKIAKPSRAFSSLSMLAGQAAEATPVADAPSVVVSGPTLVETVRDWDDIDAEDSDNPLMVSEYITDIIEYLREREPETMPNPAYMDKQKELTWEMRRVLVNWIVETHDQLRMLPETLFLAINILDRFLSKRQVAVGKFQLVGLTALMLACKYEETTTPHIEDFVYLAGNSYTVKEILNTEVFMLTVLGFDMSYPNPMTFLRRVSKAEDYNMQTRTVAKYLMEICLVDHRLIQYTPSQIAAASIYLGRRMLESGPWNPNLRHYSGYTEAELEPLVAVMLDHLLAPPAEEFVFLKYQNRDYLAVSDFCLDWAIHHQSEIRLMTSPTGHLFSTAADADYDHSRSGAVANTASAPVATTAYATAAGM
ncbi:G2/mitotic-specific cyclin [Coemansia furcata]|nr:G2/mitotic-specific cyclin [Coemansia furcata]